METVPLPVLLFDGDPFLAAAIGSRLAAGRPLVVLPQPAEARLYLQASVAAGRLPSLLVVRIRSHDPTDHGLAMTMWVREQEENELARMRIVVLTDASVAVTAFPGNTRVVAHVEDLLDSIGALSDADLSPTRLA
jgi:hypothetical protein